MTVEIDSRLCTKDQKKCKRNPGQSMNLFCNDVGKDNIAYIIKPPPRVSLLLWMEGGHYVLSREWQSLEPVFRELIIQLSNIGRNKVY